MKDFKKILYFFGLFAYILGSIGGFGYALYCKAYVIAIAVVVLAIMAFPTARTWFNEIIDNGEK